MRKFTLLPKCALCIRVGPETNDKDPSCHNHLLEFLCMPTGCSPVIWVSCHLPLRDGEQQAHSQVIHRGLVSSAAKQACRGTKMPAPN